MNPRTNSAEIARLYKEFSESFVANDDDAIRHIYRELLRLGRPRAEIVDEAVRLAGSNQGGFLEPALRKPIAGSNSMERFGINRLPSSRAAKNLVSGVVRDGSGSGASVPESKLEIGKAAIVPGVGSNSENVAERTDPVLEGGPVPLFESGQGIGILLHSPIVYLSAAVGIVLCASVAALAFLPARTAAEKLARPEPTVAAIQSPSQSSAAAPSVLSVTSAVGETQRHEPTASSASTSEGAVLLADANAGDHSTSELATAGHRPGQADTNSTGSLPVPASAAAGKKVSGSPLTRDEAMVARASETVPTRHDLPEGRGSPGIVSPLSTNVTPSGSGQKLLLSKANMATLLTRADSLLAIGDIVSGRLFYERAANGGSGEAALRLGETYDPQFLAQAHLHGVRGDIATAVFWYKRARDLGVGEAEILLGGLPAD